MTRSAPIDLSFPVQLYKSLLINTTTDLLNDYAPRLLLHCILRVLNETKTETRCVNYLTVTLNKKACLLGEGIHSSVIFTLKNILYFRIEPIFVVL